MGGGWRLMIQPLLSKEYAMHIQDEIRAASEEPKKATTFKTPANTG